MRSSTHSMAPVWRPGRRGQLGCPAQVPLDVAARLVTGACARSGARGIRRRRTPAAIRRVTESPQESRGPTSSQRSPCRGGPSPRPEPQESHDPTSSQPQLPTAVRMRGLEPPRGCPHTDLNRARLPIPPHPLAEPSMIAGRRRREVEGADQTPRSSTLTAAGRPCRHRAVPRPACPARLPRRERALAAAKSSPPPTHHPGGG